MPAYQFMPSFAKIFFSYVLYYGICPGSLVFTCYMGYRYYRKKRDWIKPLLAFITIYFLIMPVWGYAMSNIANAGIWRQIQDVKGPYFGVEKTIEEVSTGYREKKFKFSEAEKYIHFNDLRGKPVITAAYSFTGWWLAYTYVTFYPIPKLKVYLFYVSPIDESLTKKDEKTIYLPLSPSSELEKFFPWTV